MFDNIKHDLAAVFDDDLHTRKWHNLVDYLIIGMIVLSTAEVFLSTFDVGPAFRRVLRWVDIVTLVFFTVEVSLRIWVAPLVNPGYAGWKGRMKYCLSFHGFVDVVSTYPYYLQWLVPFPMTWMKVLRLSRVMRMFRVSRYMKSWRLLTEAIAEKKRELLISLQFLTVITFILSLILFFCEHDRQPDVYDNGFSSVLWAFAQYIGDPGGFGDTPPVSVPGKIIACIVGLLGIAIVAVPAGILGAGFTETIEKENNKSIRAANLEKLRGCFERKLDRPTGFQVVKPYCTITDIQARAGLTADQIVEIAEATQGYRLINLAATRTIDNTAGDILAVEHYDYNRSYGLLIDRGSEITIVSPSSFIDPCVGFFVYYLAKIGGFNYISREFGDYAPYRSFYANDGVSASREETDYYSDLKALLGRDAAWSLSILAASGCNEPEYDSRIHFGTGNKKGSGDIGPYIVDGPTFNTFISDVSGHLLDEYNINIDIDKYHDTSSPKIFVRSQQLIGKANHVIVRVAWSVMLWDSRRLKIAQTIADSINRTILHNEGNPVDSHLFVKDMGFK